MIKNRVLVSNILHPREVFSSQEKIFSNPYSNQIRFSKEKLDKYMSKQLNRTHVAARSTEIQLETTNELPTIIMNVGLVVNLIWKNILVFRNFPDSYQL